VPARDIGQVMGWKVDQVEKILMHYVDQANFVRSITDRLAKGS
jgi:hypothetical protein